jgi:2-keto-3-deoxy-L-rhamnonate aldolase RhmA
VAIVSAGGASLTQIPLLGILQVYPHSCIAEIAASCGYDFVMLDAEHGVFSDSEMLSAVQMVAGTGLQAWVRFRGKDRDAVGRYLDMGADAIIAPNVTCAEQAVEFARSMVYPPSGTRGFSAPVQRQTRFGADLVAHIAAPRGQALLLVLLESREGVRNAAAILETEGVDGAIIGPGDLSADLGGIGRFDTADYIEAVRTIERAVSATGKMLGTAPHPGHDPEVLTARDYRFLILGSDVDLFRQSMLARIEHARDACNNALQPSLST